VLRARVADLEAQVGALTEKVSVLARMAFGTSSEKAAKPAADATTVQRTARALWTARARCRASSRRTIRRPRKARDQHVRWTTRV
jgi:hypothetical protein